MGSPSPWPSWQLPWSLHQTSPAGMGLLLQAEPGAHILNCLVTHLHGFFSHSVNLAFVICNQVQRDRRKEGNQTESSVCISKEVWYERMNWEEN